MNPISLFLTERAVLDQDPQAPLMDKVNSLTVIQSQVEDN